MVPDKHHDGLIAAFNGGFKTTHGHYGMMLDGVEFVPPRDVACTFARYRDVVGRGLDVVVGRGLPGKGDVEFTDVREKSISASPSCGCGSRCCSRSGTLR